VAAAAAQATVVVVAAVVAVEVGVETAAREGTGRKMTASWIWHRCVCLCVSWCVESENV
jgi:hypothetical protein